MEQGNALALPARSGTVVLLDMQWERTSAVRTLAVRILGSLVEAMVALAARQLAQRSTRSRTIIGRYLLERMHWEKRLIEPLPMLNSATARHTKNAGLQRR